MASVIMDVRFTYISTHHKHINLFCMCIRHVHVYLYLERRFSVEIVAEFFQLNASFIICMGEKLKHSVKTLTKMY